MLGIPPSPRGTPEPSRYSRENKPTEMECTYVKRQIGAREKKGLSPRSSYKHVLPRDARRKKHAQSHRKLFWVSSFQSVPLAYESRSPSLVVHSLYCLPSGASSSQRIVATLYSNPKAGGEERPVLSQACHFCKSRHLKCDGNSPVRINDILTNAQ